MSMGGGGDGQSTKFDPPDWTKDLYPDAMKAAVGLQNTPYQQYQGMKIAPWNDYQQTAAQMTADRAMFGAPDLNAGRGAAMGVAGGQYFNPYGDEKYTDQIIAANAGDMAKAHARGTAAQTDASAARSGAYGGSAYNEMTGVNTKALDDSIGQMANQTRLAQNTMRSQNWNADVGNMLQGGALAGQLSQDDWKAMDALSKQGGDINKYTQSLLGDAYGTWKDEQMYPYQQFDWLMSKLGQGSGQYGSNYTDGGSGQSPYGMAAGLGLLGAGLFK